MRVILGKRPCARSGAVSGSKHNTLYCITMNMYLTQEIFSPQRADEGCHGNKGSHKGNEGAFLLSSPSPVHNPHQHESALSSSSISCANGHANGMARFPTLSLQGGHMTYGHGCVQSEVKVPHNPISSPSIKTLYLKAKLTISEISGNLYQI